MTQDDQVVLAAAEGPRSPHDALQWAHAEIGDPGWSGMCLSFVRTGYNLPGVYASAHDAWQAAEERHEGTDWTDWPKGAPVFFSGPNPDWHVAYYDGGGDIVTTNSGTGYPLVQSIAEWESWGYHLLGWTEDLNGYHVCNPNGTGGVPDSEVIVPYDSKSTDSSQKLKTGGDWTTLEISDDGDTSLVYSPGAFAALVQVYAEGLPKGSTGKLRFYVTDTDESGKGGKRQNTYPTVEFSGTSGTTAAEVVQFGKLGKATASGHSLRLRVEAAVDSSELVKVTMVAAKWFH